MNGIKHINMDYEKKYNDALNLAKSYYGKGSNEFLDTIFPELRESEDERIRKELVEKISNLACGCFISQEQKQKFLAYLEKQKEQIPYTDFVIRPHKGDDNNPYDMGVSEAQEYAIKRGFGVPFIDGEVYVDERHIIQTVGNIIRWADEHPKEQKPAEWKPSEAQMDALNYAIAEWDGGKKLEGLYDLRTDLKKLM